MTLRSLGVKRIWTACLSRLVARRNEFIALGPSVHPSVAKADSLPPPPSQLRLSLPIETVVSPSKAAVAMAAKAAKADKRTDGGDHRVDGRVTTDGENEGAAAMGAEFVCPKEKENKTNSVNGRARREKE